MAQKRRVFLAAGIGLLVLVLGVMSFTLWFAYHSSQVADRALRSANKVAQSDVPKIAPIASFEDCQKAAGSMLLETFPEQCRTVGGKTFTKGQKTLVITEWGVQVEYTSADILSYRLGNPDNTVSVISQGLMQKYGCTTFGAGVINREVGSARNGLSNTGETIAVSYAKHPSSFTKVGDYYYRFVHDQAACADPIPSTLVTAQNKANDLVKTLVPKLVTAK